jgi:hypothetical protein
MNATQMSKTAVVSTILITAKIAYAQTYMQLDWMDWTINSKVNADSYQSKPTTIGLTVGYEITPHLAVEGMYQSSLSGGDVKINGATQSTPVTNKLSHFYAISLKPKIPVSDSLTIFAKLSAGSGKATAYAGQYSASSTGSRTAFGIGIDYELGDKKYLTASYIRSSKKNYGLATDVYYKGMSIGIGYRF